MHQPALHPRCPRCAVVVPDDAPAGLCPACVLDSMVDMDQLLISDQSFGRYRIGRLLGRGGMGEVYEAEESNTGRRIALKVLNQRLAGPDARDRFLLEGRLAASISHPNIVYIVGSDEIDGTPVIAMELLPGGTLKDRVKDSGPLSPAEAVDAILQVSAGLEAAHAKGILHRDVKPSNCFIDRDGTVKVGDFGLSISSVTAMAAAKSSPAAPNGFQGTPQFASPEQMRGDSLDLRSDIFSVGATLYYLLTSHPPFDEHNLKGRLMIPLHVQRDVPPGLLTVISRCLARNRDARFATYSELAEALQQFTSAAEAAPSAATGRRIAALALDVVILLMIAPVPMAIVVGAGIARDPASVALWAIVAPGLLYWSLFQGLTGSTPGKRALGLRVITANGRRFTAVAATRIPELPPAPATAADPVPAPAAATSQSMHVRIGPYDVIGSIGFTDVGEMFTAFDPKLKRQVWLHILPAGVPAVPSERHALSRPSRLHWLNGHRTEQGGWDAYGALDGAPLDTFFKSKPAWHTVRRWLLDLARELDASLSDASGADVSIGSVTLERTWITAAGRAVLLDFNAPGVPASEHSVCPWGPDESSQLTPRSAQRFLHDVARCAIGLVPSPPLPVSATRFLDRIAFAPYPELADVVEALTHLETQPDRVTPYQRTLSLVPDVAFTLSGLGFLGLMLAPIGALITPGWSRISLTTTSLGALGLAALAIASAVAFRGGFWLRSCGIAVVLHHGDEVSRGRAAARALIAWSWAPLQIAAAIAGWPALAAAIWLLKVGAVLYASSHPDRGLQDRLAGTYLVPR